MVIQHHASRMLLSLLLTIAGGCAASTHHSIISEQPAERPTETANAAIAPPPSPAIDPDALVLFSEGGKWGAKDPQGRIVIAPQFDRPFRFHEGLAGVYVGDAFGFINPAGQWVIAPMFDADHPSHFIGRVCAVSYQGRLAVINRFGTFVWQPGLRQAANLAGGIYIQTSDGRKGFLNNAGRLLPNDQPNPDYYRNTATCG